MSSNDLHIKIWKSMTKHAHPSRRCVVSTNRSSTDTSRMPDDGAIITTNRCSTDKSRMTEMCNKYKPLFNRHITDAGWRNCNKYKPLFVRQVTDDGCRSCVIVQTVVLQTSHGWRMPELCNKYKPLFNRQVTDDGDV